MAAVIPAALLLGAVAMRSLLLRAPAAVSVDLAQPVPVATYWHAFGAAQFAALLAASAAAMVGYGVWVIGVRRMRASWQIVAGITVLALLAVWCAPILFSSDVYAYAAYGELARLRLDPYAHLPLPPGSVIFDAAIVQWGNPPPACVYGLAFVWIAQALVTLLHPLGIVTVLGGFRCLSSAALLATAPLAYYAYRGDAADKVRAAATIALNPVAIWCAGEGHNDAFVVAVMLAGGALVACGRPIFGGALASTAGAFKLPGIAGGAGAWMLDRRAATGAAIGAAAAIASSIPLLRAFHAGLGHAQYAPQASFQAVAYAAFSLWLSGGMLQSAVWAVTAAAAASIVTGGIAKLRRNQMEGWTYLALGGWLLVPNPYPWYGIWLLPIAAAAPRTPGAIALIGLSFSALLRYVPDAVATPGAPATALLGVAACLPLLALFGARSRSAIMQGPS